MTKFSTDSVDISEHNSGTCHENVAKPGTAVSVVNSEPGMDGWTAATWADWRSIGRLLLVPAAFWSVIGYFIWRWW